ncbi:MAG: alanine dehydrogenase [Deltaproteobacteria bacterium]|nr:alanine dehydrogenase [Deltaproteobacteria bacterium]MBW2071618.1 alanine dehydrogenase [Deltaproteobacteria bacterium]
MIIGVPKEIKTEEYRVGIVPAGVKLLLNDGHRVLVEQDAGKGAGILDDEYRQAGAEIVSSAAEVYNSAELVMKVKEPLPPEYDFLRPGLVIYTYLHLAPAPELTAVLLEKDVIAIGYETIQQADGSLPLLTPMSEIAGRMAVQVGAHYLEKTEGGRGVLLGGVPGVYRGQVTILGGGVVGTNAAKIAVGMGAKVTVIDINQARLMALDDIFGSTITTLMSNPDTIERSVRDSHLVIGAVLVPGGRAPSLISRDMVSQMKPGTVIVDVAVDQGGCCTTCKPTTHDNPVYFVDSVIHYCVANMPGAVPRTATFALTNVTIVYALIMANEGIEKSLATNEALAAGVNIYRGHVTHEAVARDLDYPFHSLDTLIKA